MAGGKKAKAKAKAQDARPGHQEETAGTERNRRGATRKTGEAGQKSEAGQSGERAATPGKKGQSGERAATPEKTGQSGNRAAKPGKGAGPGSTAKVPRAVYEAELLRLQTELVKLQEWVRAEGARLVVVFEGRDAAGKGSTIKRVTEYLNPGSPGSRRSRSPPNANAPSGTSSAMRSTCRPPVRSCSSTGPGTTAPVSST